MSALLFLTSDDFLLTKAPNGLVLSTQIRGFSLLLFYSDRCPNCRNMLPIFKKLPLYVSDCVFGLTNVDKNRKIIEMSNETIKPIDYVPFTVFFLNGRMLCVYKGPPDLDELKRFIFEYSQHIAKTQTISLTTTRVSNNNNRMMMKPTRGNIKEHSSGIGTYGVPLYGEDDEKNFTYIYKVFDEKAGYINDISNDKMNYKKENLGQHTFRR